MTRRELALTLAATPLVAEPARNVYREATEWTDVWMPHTDKTDLPHVILIGDSITRGYWAAVERRLAGKAYCARLTNSKSVGDPALAREFVAFLTGTDFAVVHFNNGLHGWRYSEKEFEQYLPEAVSAIRAALPKARLVWASITPIAREQASGASNQRIAARNASARAYFEAQRVPVDDLNALMATHQNLHTDDFHYKAEGYELLADQVAASVVAALG